MIIDNSDLWDSLPPVREIKARVVMYNGSTTPAATFTQDDRLKSFTVERVGESSKFFGYGICQKINIKLVDVNRELNITTANSFRVYLCEGYKDYITPFPVFYVSEVHRNENTNELSITAYDLIYKANTHKVAEIELNSYSIYEFMEAAAANISAIGVGFRGLALTDSSLQTTYTNGANFDGSEDMRSVLNALAEVTQTVYYINADNRLVFVRLKDGSNITYTINKEDYFTLDSGDNRRLTCICHATELGDNVSDALTETGTTQYIRNNPFWELRTDIGALVSNALAAVGGLTINQFNCSWRGNYFLEVGDKLALVTKDNDTVTAYLLNDVVEYNGGLSQKTKWSYTETSESDKNPVTLGDKLKDTYARVDKANREIEIVASEAGANSAAISALELNTGSISASVEEIEKNINEQLGSVNADIETITNKVNATMTAEDIQIEIQKEVEKGANKVTTTTGFTFNDNGLNISKTGSEMSTTITEDGMTVKKGSKAVLTADNEGVDAVNLKASTYLIIGKNSRFEDYGNRTGCFWIGG